MMTSATKGNIMYSDAAAVAQVFGVESVSVPTGTKDVPALTCRHLAQALPQLHDGLYWVDPNGGGPEDAIQVNCNFKTMQTCVSARKEVFAGEKKKQASDGDDMTWMGEVSDFDHFLYAVEGTQLAMLKLRSLSGQQQVTVSCHDAMKLYADNDAELSADDKHATFSVVANTCQNVSGAPKEVVIDVSGPAIRLPIRDVAFAGVESKMDVRLGQVCFQ